MAEIVEIAAQEMRLPDRAADALERGDRVQVSRYGQPSRVVLAWDKFVLIQPVLDLIEEGVVISAEMLMSAGDAELARDLGEDREATAAENAAIDAMLSTGGD